MIIYRENLIIYGEKLMESSKKKNFTRANKVSKVAE